MDKGRARSWNADVVVGPGTVTVVGKQRRPTAMAFQLRELRVIDSVTDTKHNVCA
jgi:hypothetical protein